MSEGKIKPDGNSELEGSLKQEFVLQSSMITISRFIVFEIILRPTLKNLQ